jgi:hypothetical protein
LALAACADDFRFPISLFFIESTLEPAGLRDGSPGLLGAWDMGDQAALREWDLTGPRGFTFFYQEATG